MQSVSQGLGIGLTEQKQAQIIQMNGGPCANKTVYKDRWWERSIRQTHTEEPFAEYPASPQNLPGLKNKEGLRNLIWRPQGDRMTNMIGNAGWDPGTEQGCLGKTEDI